MTDNSISSREELLNMSTEEVSEAFDNAEAFADALVDSHRDDLLQRGIEVSEEKRDTLESLFLDIIEEKEIWD